jgi:GntR family transcriptional regulator
MTQSMRPPGPPVYLQIRDAIIAGILDGRYGGDRALPSVRALAATEAVNPLTVSKAYQELQAIGLVASRKGVGLYVAAGAREKLMLSERDRFLRDEWPQLKDRMRRLGLEARELLADA